MERTNLISRGCDNNGKKTTAQRPLACGAFIFAVSASVIYKMEEELIPAECKLSIKGQLEGAVRSV
jgi:hypothetical protein